MTRAKLFFLGFIFFAAWLNQTTVRGNGIREEFQQTYTLSPAGSVRLNNINGGIEIKVWDKNEVEVDAVKHADDKSMMDQLKIVVDATRDTVDIDTKYPENSNTHNDEGPSVEYTITVPSGANLDRIKTINGEIEISGVQGKIDASTINGTVRASGINNECQLETVNGKIDAGFVSLKSEADVTLKSVNGSIVANFPSGIGARIKAKTVSGKISNDFGLVSSYEKDKDSFVKVGDSIDGKIGDGGANVDAETVNGSIKILKSGE